MTGSLQEQKMKSGKKFFYIVLNTSPKKTWLSTGLEVKGNRRQANELLKKTILEYEKREQLEVTNNDILACDYFRSWVKTTDVRETTRKNYNSYLNHHIIPYFKKLNIKLKDIKPSTLRAFYEYCKNTKKLSPKTIRNQQGVMSKALRDAYYDDLIMVNPHDKIKLIRVQPTKIQTLTLDEYRRFLDEAKTHRLYIAIMLLCETAIRRSELLGIEWKNVDLKSGEINICATRTSVSKDKVELNTKTESSNRTMYISDSLIELLKQEKKQQKEYERLFGSEYIKNDLVIKYPDGRPYSNTQVTRQIGNLTEKFFGKRITPHKLRHTVASIMVDCNIPIYNVSKFLGHSGTQITERTYVHAKKDFNRSTLDLFQKSVFQ